MNYASLSDSLKRDFKGKEWKELDHHEDESGLIYEYIPKEEGANKWSEKVTVQIFPGERLSLKDYLTQFHGMMQARSESGFKSTLLEDQPQEKIYEWTVHNSLGQFEMGGWMRVLTDDKALKAFHVQVKKPEDMTALRKQWVPLIKAYDFKPVPSAGGTADQSKSKSTFQDKKLQTKPQEEAENERIDKNYQTLQSDLYPFRRE
jgi:hypothetical protein